MYWAMFESTCKKHSHKKYRDATHNELLGRLTGEYPCRSKSLPHRSVSELIQPGLLKPLKKRARSTLQSTSRECCPTICPIYSRASHQPLAGWHRSGSAMAIGC